MAISSNKRARAGTAWFLEVFLGSCTVSLPFHFMGQKNVTRPLFPPIPIQVLVLEFQREMERTQGICHKP
jgi:hypothetical protein